MNKVLKLFVSLFLACSCFGCATVTQFMKDLKVDETVKEEKVKEKEEKKVEEVKEEKEEIPELTVDELLENPDMYDGKDVRVQGLLPEGGLEDAEGNIVIGLMNEASTNFIALTGVTPDIGNCLTWVNGKITVTEGEPTLEATSFEKIEDYQFEVVE